MRFVDEGNEALGLFEAAARGYPASGVFSPTSDADLRPAIYAPESTFRESSSSAIAALFPEDVDPLLADRLAARAFPQAPAGFLRGDDILVADYTAGPSGSAADSEAAFLAGILAQVARRKGPLLLLADGSGPDGAALSEAIVGLRDLSLALLYPAGQAACGLRGPRLAREGGQTSLIAVHGDRAAVDRLIRAAVGDAAGEASGGAIAGMSVVAAGPANPARVAARIVGLASSFASLRKGVAGDFFIGVRGGEGFGLAACLWAWKLGLPLTGIILSVGDKGVLGIDPAGRRMVERFDAEYPGVIRSLALLHHVDRESAFRYRDELCALGGPKIDLASAMTLAASENALDAGLRGHARIIVPWGASLVWDEGLSGSELGAALRDARVDAEISPSLDELTSALTA
jgi:hypothetical protein